MITNFKINCMGTVSFMGQFSKMRKAQDFIVYPMHDQSDIIKIQSNTRIGIIRLTDGAVAMSQPHPSGAYFVHLQSDRLTKDTLPTEDLETLKGWIRSSGGMKVGNNSMHVYTDNIGAYTV